MKAEENQRPTQIRNEHSSKLRRHAINQVAIGSVILLWGSLLLLKQAGMIGTNVSTWPFPLVAFGMLLVAGGVYRLSKSHIDAS